MKIVKLTYEFGRILKMHYSYLVHLQDFFENPETIFLYELYNFELTDINILITVIFSYFELLKSHGIVQSTACQTIHP
jgi:hypothetical protein